MRRDPSRAQRLRIRLLLAALAMSLALPAAAQTRPEDLAIASLEDLMNMQVTSASRKEQRVEDVPASVYVITQADIRQSGMTSVPELLRLVPGVQVARISSNKWAISARGFGTLFSNKLLVLVDGRSIYDRLNSGEFWESEDLVVDDIDRIEVICGPGGTIWGANSMNGVINILTKSAADSQGASVRVAGGTFDGAQASARYGGLFSGGAYRVFTQWSDHGESVLADRTPAHDEWRSLATGFRLDGAHGRDAFMVEGNANAQQLYSLFNHLDGPVPSPSAPFQSDTQSLNLLGRWTRTLGSGSSLEVQSFFDTRPRNDPGVHARQVTADVDLQYHASVAGRHDIVAGAGYRFVRVGVTSGFSYGIDPDESTDSVTSAFVQDEIALAGGRVHLTLGSKIARDTERVGRI